MRSALMWLLIALAFGLSGLSLRGVGNMSILTPAGTPVQCDFSAAANSQLLGAV